MRCDLRTFNECACPVGVCHQQPNAIPVPLIRPVCKDFAMFLGAATIITIATLLAVSETEKHLAAIDRENQENLSWRK